jgi:Amt family ammonium transporter
MAAVTTTLAAAAGAVGAMSTAWLVTGKPDVGFTLNGVLAGLVGITAGTASLSFGASILTGLIAGVVLVFSVMALERVGIDDRLDRMVASQESDTRVAGE